MANYTWTRNAVDSTLISDSAPSGDYSAAGMGITGAPTTKFIWRMAEIPAEHKGRGVVSATVRVRGGSRVPIQEGSIIYYYQNDLTVFHLSRSTPYEESLETMTLGRYSSGEWNFVRAGTVKVPVAASSEYAYRETAVSGLDYGADLVSLQWNVKYTEPGNNWVSGPKSDYVPSFVLELADLKLQAVDVSPASGFVNEKAANTFRWGISAQYPALEVMPTQASAKLEWRVTGALAVQTVNITGGATSVQIPANTFPSNGSIQWRVTITSTDGVTGDPTEWYTLTTTDATDMAVTPISPVATYLDGSEPQTFSWAYNISTGTAPSGYRLRYSTDGGTTWVVFAQGSGGATSVQIPANTFPAGSILWQAAAANSDGVWSAYSPSAAIAVVAAPERPSLTVDTSTARPVIQWQSVGQVAWSVTVTDESGAVIYRSGLVYGEQKSVTLPDFVPNGNYIATLRVVNQYNLTSPAAAAGFALSLPSIPPPLLSATAAGDKVQLSATGDFEKIYILRDGVPIAEATDGNYIDHTALGAVTYTARGVTSDGNFGDSEPVSVLIEVKGTILSLAEDPEQKVKLWLRKGADTTRDSTLALVSAANHYAGRSLPVVELSEFVEEDLSFAFSFVVSAEEKNLKNIIRKGKTLLYRDGYGDRFFVTVSSVRFDRDHVAHDFTISAQKVDFVERISY